MQVLENILRTLRSHRFPLVIEKETQKAIEEKFSDNGIVFNREHRLDAQNIPDFFINEYGIAIEVKIKGNAKKIYKQCERYCSFDEVKGLIIVTNRSMGFPSEINGKPCYLVNLGKAWL